MHFTVVHLSDIHVKGEHDDILSRGALIAAAVRSRLGDATSIICVISGDLAFSGLNAQYSLCRQFLEAFRTAIGISVFFALAPGNHDLDFDRDSVARDILIKKTIETSPSDIDPSVVEVAVGPEAAFFEFRDSLIDGGDALPGTRLAYKYDFVIEGQRVEVRCLNSAWMSRINEKAGALYLPRSVVLGATPDAFVISVLHHPYNWLTPTSKPTIRALEAVSNAILTGHEHEQDRSIVARPDSGVTTTYFEAGALHGADPELSEFTVLQFDPANRRYRFYAFVWNGDLYKARDVVAEWDTLPLSSSRSAQPLVPTPDFSRWLDDSGIPWLVTDPHRRTRTDIFIYPDLVESLHDPSLKSSRLTIAGDSVYQTVRSQDVTRLTGPSKSGRSTLARALFCDFVSDGFVPIYIDASDPGLRAGTDLPAPLIRRLKQQYGDSATEPFIQLPRDRRVILLDNAERLGGRADNLAALLQQFTKLAGHVVILGDNSVGALTQSAFESWVDGERRSFEILPLNFSARERLADKWFAHGDYDDFELSRQMENATRILDTIIGKNYVPAYPIYIVALLKAAEEGTTVDSKASTHGYFYDLLIRQALTSGSATRDISIYRGFLTHLARDMYTGKRSAFLDHELRPSFDAYDNKIMMAGLQYDSLIDELCQRGMLVQEGGETWFRYPYLYNYFVANYIAENVSDPQARSDIDDLTRQVSQEEAADILMFLAHLSHDPYILQALRTTADGLFTSYDAETLDAIAHGGEDDVSLEYVEQPQRDARREVAANKDQQALRAKATSSESVAGEPLRAAVLSSLQTIRVMGQILKNFPSLTADAKIGLMRSTYTLSLRLLSVGLSSLDRDRENFVERTVAAIRSVFPGVPEEKLRAHADRTHSITRVIMTYGVLKLVVTSLASPDLDRIYGIVFGEGISGAETIIRTGLNIETKSVYPGAEVIRSYEHLKSPFAKLTLRVFVIDSFNRLYVSPTEKQRVCAKLSIAYKVLGIRRAERRAIGGSLNVQQPR